MTVLEEKAQSVRRRIFDFKTKTGAGHLASCLSCVDLIVSLYCDDKTTFDHTKDTVVHSKAHGSPSVYPILADLGYYPQDELEKYCTPEGILRLHSDQSIPGCAAGLALVEKNDIYVVLGDAELYEGSVWETLIFASHYNLNNLRLIVDRNGMGILGKTEELLKLEPLEDKFSSFGFDVCNHASISFFCIWF